MMEKRSQKKNTIVFFFFTCVPSPQHVVVVLGVTFFMSIDHGISRSSSFRVIPPGRHRELLSCSVGNDDTLSRFFMCSSGSLQGNSPEDRHPSDVGDGAGPRTLLLPEVTVESVTSVTFHDQSPALAFQGGKALDPSQREGIACKSSDVLCYRLPPLPLPHPPSLLLPPMPTHTTCPHTPHAHTTHSYFPPPSFLVPSPATRLHHHHHSPPTSAVHTLRPPRNVGTGCTFEAVALLTNHRVWGNHNIHNTMNCKKRQHYVTRSGAQR